MRRLINILILSLITTFMYSQATFQSINSGNWASASTWTIVAGSDSDGNNWPDANDVVTIVSTNSVTISTTTYFGSLTIQNNAFLISSGKNLGVRGNLDIQGSIIGTVNIYIQANCTFNSVSTFTNSGSWWIQAGTLNITSNTFIQKPNDPISFQNSTVRTINNHGIVTIGSISLNNNNCIWNNLPNSILTINRPAGITTSLGILNASASPNTVRYTSATATTIKPTTYYNLTLSSASTKSIIAHLNVLNDLSFLAGNILDANNYNITLGGNWINNANTTVLNQATVTLNPTGSKSITRSTSEVFNNLVLNGSGTTLLGNTININGNLTINSGIMDVSSSNFTINIEGNFLNNGSFVARNGLVNLNGTSLQSISGASNTEFYALSLNNSSGAIINSQQTVTDVLTVTNGNFNSNGNLTLISNSSKTARLGNVGSGGSFSGNMIIQKHISSRVKNWHDLSSPVQSTTIFDWDDEMYMSGFSNVDDPVGIAGVDGSAAGFKSVRTYNESTAAYANVTNSTTILNPGRGYQIYLSDDFSDWNAKTFDSRGVPNFGTRNIPLSYTAARGVYAGVNLVGNPFASAIDYSLVNKINTDGHAYGYNNGVWTDYGTDAILTSHQGFWAYAISSGASISIPETAKSAITTTSFYRSIPNYGIKLIYTNSEIQFFNEAKVNFENKATEKWDIELDAIYMNNTDADASTISFYTNEMKLLTNTINDDNDNVTLPLELYSPKPGLYYIQPSVLNTGKYKYVWIENIKTGEQFELTKSIPVDIKQEGENNDYILRFSKNSQNAELNQNVFSSDLMIFNFDQILNLKANHSSHYINKLTIYDLTGKIILELSDLEINKNSIMNIDISNLNRGVFIVNVIDINNHSISKKIIK